MILYIVCIMSFVWRTGTTDDANRGPMTPEGTLTFRILVSILLSLGVIYFVLIVSTLRKYGEMMDQVWNRRLIGWRNYGYDSTKYYPLGFDPHLHYTDPCRESTHTHIRRDSNSLLQSPGPHGEFSSSNRVRRHGKGTDNRNNIHGSQSVSKDEDNLEMRSNNASPPLPSSPTVSMLEY